MGASIGVVPCVNIFMVCFWRTESEGWSLNEGKVAGENISRMGMLHFKNDKLPDTKALLRIHDGHIDITIVWNPSDSTFERCFFSEHVFYADDPDRKKYVYDLPKQIWFRDSQGSVDLLSCKVRSCKEKYQQEKDHLQDDQAPAE